MSTSRSVLRQVLPSSGPTRPLLGLVALVALVGLPVLAGLLVDLDGAWVLGLLAGLVLLAATLAGLAAIGTSRLLHAQHARSDELEAARTAELAELVRTRTDGLHRTVERSTDRLAGHVAGEIAEATRTTTTVSDRNRDGLRNEIERLLLVESIGDVRQTQALLQLFAAVRIERPLPGLSGFAASPDLLLFLVHLLREERPAVVVECGSGSSTLLMALTVQQYGLPTRIISIDHEAFYGEQTRRTLSENGVDDVAEVRIAPLAPSPVPEHEPQWYDVDALGDLPPIDLLIVDGPPGSGGREARYPAFPVLRDRLAPGAIVLMDDYDRDDERVTGERWQASAPGSTLERVDLYKGLGVLRMP
ncbi:class I SAM-dependent methyltransferase [Nocardioides sp. ChNu-153]|uniref:class I SAM-dependent methyltransferase n=1 Tax=unclassified Nocardioides TaxID=2615069 RepID=UPI002405E377|nr:MULTISPECIES: class I SAM-dependent methyltransferase [unclassified Nocardioides]MDF9716205.1 class I SAM-dependent methyltransferase [Nocardioides sp. ChNu-99]MDN7121595.1 class I SAM-dependent methyltransferase [Nocardioides sp. ChNu-153]